MNGRPTISRAPSVATRISEASTTEPDCTRGLRRRSNQFGNLSTHSGRVSVETLSLDMERQVAASPDAARRALISALEQMRFSVDSVRGTVIEAHTGSPWLPRLGERRPLRARAVVVSHGQVVKISLHLTDGEEVVLDSTGAARVYARLFTRSARTWTSPCASWIRRWLPLRRLRWRRTTIAESPETAQRLDPAAVLHRDDPDRMTPPDRSGSWRRDATRWSILSRPRESWPWRRSFDGTRRSLRALMETLDSVQSAVERAARLGDSVPVTLDERGKRVVDFLHRQLAARRQHPMREVLKCRDCGLERISNPDLRKGNGSKMAWDSPAQQPASRTTP